VTQTPASTAQTARQCAVTGAGLGLRRGLMDELEAARPSQVSFMETAPENWIGVGGASGRRFRRFTERWPFVCHGLSLSLGGPAPLDMKLLADIRGFLREHRIRRYSEHLSYCSDEAHLYDLMPLPFTEEAARHVAARIRDVQDFLGQRIAVENVSAYLAPGREMDETDFICLVLEEADCDLLLDVNNVYVNSVNFRFDADEYLEKLPAQRIAWCHIAGHFNEADDLIVDTHGADVIAPVWRLLEKAYSLFGALPTLLERDFNFPPLPRLLDEVERIREMQGKHPVPDAA